MLTIDELSRKITDELTIDLKKCSRIKLCEDAKLIGELLNSISNELYAMSLLKGEKNVKDFLVAKSNHLVKIKVALEIEINSRETKQK